MLYAYENMETRNLKKNVYQKKIREYKLFGNKSFSTYIFVSIYNL